MTEDELYSLMETEVVIDDGNTISDELFENPVGYVVKGRRDCFIRIAVPVSDQECLAENKRRGKVRTREYDRLRHRFRLIGYRDAHQIDEAFADVHAHSPWLANVSAHLWKELKARAASDTSHIRFGPIIIHGAPGCGKTHYVRALAANLKIQFSQINGADLTNSFRLVGIEFEYSSSSMGVPLKTIFASGVANPIILVDEVDKISIRTEANPVEALLAMTDPSTNDRWRCPYLDHPVDMSHILWVFTANDLSRIPPPLLDRCTVIKAQMPQRDDLYDLVSRLYEPIGSPSELVSGLVSVAERKDLSLRSLIRIAQAVVQEQEVVLH